MNLHLRDDWCEGADVCTLCISIVALWTSPVAAQSIHLWAVCVSHLSIIQKDALWLSISSLGSTNQNSWEISSNVCSAPVLWCWGSCTCFHPCKVRDQLITPFPLITDNYYCASEGWMHIQNSPSLRSLSSMWHVCLWQHLYSCCKARTVKPLLLSVRAVLCTSARQRAGTQLLCLPPPPPSLPGSCVHTSALLPLKWLLFWKRAERISAPAWSTYWKCLTDSQQLLGYLRLREWWVIEVFFTSGMPDPVSLCSQRREVICKPSVKIYNRWSIFFTSTILAVSLKCPFALIGHVSKGRECCTLHPLWERCRALLSTIPAETVLRPNLFLHSPSEICCIT